MLNEPNFKPSKKLLNLWICLPQNTISINKEEVPPLFGQPKNFTFNYIFFFTLIGLEIFTILFLAEYGVDYTLMLVLMVSEFIIAIIPLMIEQLSLNLCLPFVKAKLFADETKLSLSKPDDQGTGVNQPIEASIKHFKQKKYLIKFISFIIFMVILGFGFWKFITYYGIYKSKIWVFPAGRLILITIALGIITHLTSTKITILSLLVWGEKYIQISLKRANRGDFTYNDNYIITPIDIKNLSQKPNFTRVEHEYKLLKGIDRQDYINLSEEEKENILIIKDGNTDRYFGSDQSFSDNAFICDKKLFMDSELNSMISSHTSTFEKRLIASTGKTIQLSHLSH